MFLSGIGRGGGCTPLPQGLLPKLSPVLNSLRDDKMIEPPGFLSTPTPYTARDTASYHCQHNIGRFQERLVRLNENGLTLGLA